MDTSVASLTKLQAQRGLPQTGLPDPPTLVAGGIYKPSYTAGSPTTRDLIGISNQIPQWAWLGGGAVFCGLAYWAYRSANRKGR